MIYQWTRFGNFFMACQYEKNNFCEAFVCYSKEKCTARGKDGKPLYSDYKSMDDVKRETSESINHPSTKLI
jgi:hypothetical protein